LSAYEILLSESQERMLAVILEENDEKVKNILEKWQIDYEVIGKITNTKRVIFKSEGKIVVDLPVDIIVDLAPEYDRPFNLPLKRKDKEFDLSKLNLEKCLNNILKNINYAHKGWVYDQYDSTVMGDTINEPGLSSGIVKIHNSNKAIGATTDCNPLYIRINPEKGMCLTVCESYRNLIASNLKPMAITNNLNFASPLDQNIMGELVLSLNGLKETALYFDTPIVSGNVSLYNQTNDEPIKPTPVIGCVGYNSDYKKIISNIFQKNDQQILMIGSFLSPKNSPYFLQDQLGFTEISAFNDICDPDFKLENKHKNFLFESFNSNLIESCNDISKGGIIHSLIKMIKNELGFSIKIENELDLFVECIAGYIVVINSKKYEKVLNKAKSLGVNIKNLGVVTNKRLEINNSKLNFNSIYDEYLNIFSDKIKN